MVWCRHSDRAQPISLQCVRRLLWLTPLIVLTACGSQAPVDKLAAELKTVASWAATAHMVGEAWLAGTVPIAYATQALEQGQQTLRQKRNTFSSLAIPADVRSTLLEHVQNLEHTMGQMQAAIVRTDRTALTQQIGHLALEEHTITVIARGGKAQP